MSTMTMIQNFYHNKNVLFLSLPIIIFHSESDELFHIWKLQCHNFLSGVFQLCAYQRTTAEPAPSNNQDS